jgi:HSP20 family protein
MDIKKFVPWNWFKKEEENNQLPIQRASQISPASSISQLHDEVDRVFNSMLKGFNFSSNFPDMPSMGINDGSSILRPNVDISSDDNAYTVKVEVPGVKQKDINLEIDNGTLTVSGEKKHEKEEKDKHYYHMEQSYGSFQRMLSLPEDADEENVKASFKNGVLTITLPRTDVAKKDVKQIPINE